METQSQPNVPYPQCCAGCPWASCCTGCTPPVCAACYEGRPGPCGPQDPRGFPGPRGEPGPTGAQSGGQCSCPHGYAACGRHKPCLRASGHSADPVNTAKQPGLCHTRRPGRHIICPQKCCSRQSLQAPAAYRDSRSLPTASVCRTARMPCNSFRSCLHCCLRRCRDRCLSRSFHTR